MMADLHHLHRAAGRDRVQELLAGFDLTDAAGRPATTYSGGMRWRLDLAMTLVGQPRVIFLDEPTTGLDPRGRHGMWDSICGLVTDGVTVFLTTQYLDEADALADRVALLDRGCVVATGSPAELKRSVGGGHIDLTFPEPSQLAAAARLLKGTPDESTLTLRVPGRFSDPVGISSFPAACSAANASRVASTMSRMVAGSAASLGASMPTRYRANAMGTTNAACNLRALYRLPTVLVTAYWRRVLNGPRGELWFGAHSRAAPEEMHALARDLQKAMRDTGRQTPNLKRLLATPS